MPGWCAMIISNSNIFTVIGAINKIANALVAGTTIRTAKITSSTFTTTRNPVAYNRPIKVLVSPVMGGMVRKCKK